MATQIGPRLYVEGAAETQAALAALPEAFRIVVSDSIEVGTQIIFAEALGRVPVGAVDGGELRDSLEAEISENGLTGTVSAGDEQAPYATYVEFGTNDTRAQPFLYPAFKLGARYVRKAIRDWAELAGEKVRLKTKRKTMGAAAKASRAKKVAK